MKLASATTIILSAMLLSAVRTTQGALQARLDMLVGAGTSRPRHRHLWVRGESNPPSRGEAAASRTAKCRLAPGAAICRTRWIVGCRLRGDEHAGSAARRTMPAMAPKAT
jgi:hypothetical protein